MCALLPMIFTLIKISENIFIVDVSKAGKLGKNKHNKIHHRKC